MCLGWFNFFFSSMWVEDEERPEVWWEREIEGERGRERDRDDKEEQFDWTADWIIMCEMIFCFGYWKWWNSNFTDVANFRDKSFWSRTSFCFLNQWIWVFLLVIVDETFIISVVISNWMGIFILFSSVCQRFDVDNWKFSVIGKILAVFNGFLVVIVSVLTRIFCSWITTWGSNCDWIFCFYQWCDEAKRMESVLNQCWCMEIIFS